MDPMLRFAALREGLRQSLWFLPATAVVAALAVGFALGRLVSPPGGELDWLLFSGDNDSARGLLSTLLGAFVTVTGVVFSLTIVALQIASQQFSPRLLRTFLRNRGTQAALGVFLATCAYLTAVLQALPTDAGDVPRVAVTLAMLLSLCSLGTLVYFIHHITRSIRVEAIMLGVERETIAAIRAVYPDAAAPEPTPEQRVPPPGAAVLLADRSGYLQAVDLPVLVDAARDAGALVRLNPRVGSHVARGELLAWVWADRPGGTVEDLGRLEIALGDGLQLGFDRTMRQDVAFGLGQLVDIAIRAISPAINDPRTAVEATHHLAVLVCELGPRHLHWLIGADGDGTIRAVVERHTFEDYLALALDQIRRYGAGEPLVTTSLLELLGDCAGAVDAGRRDALLRHVDLIVEAAERATVQAGDLAPVLATAAETRRRIDRLCGDPAIVPPPRHGQERPLAPRY